MQMTQAIADAGVVGQALDEVVARAKEEGFKANDLGWGELPQRGDMAQSALPEAMMDSIGVQVLRVLLELDSAAMLHATVL